MTTQWTPEQIENIERYGKCTVCGEPREKENLYDEKGKLIGYGLTCPNGHRGW